jgi:hypothetical protein
LHSPPVNLACRDLVPAFPQRSPPWYLATAACGGLRSAHDCRPRRALLHHSHSWASPIRRRRFRVTRHIAGVLMSATTASLARTADQERTKVNCAPSHVRCAMSRLNDQDAQHTALVFLSATARTCLIIVPSCGTRPGRGVPSERSSLCPTHHARAIDLVVQRFAKPGHSAVAENCAKRLQWV